MHSQDVPSWVKGSRKEDIKGDADKLQPNDPKDQQTALEGDRELELPAEKH
jgi:hypothetical protein